MKHFVDLELIKNKIIDQLKKISIDINWKKLKEWESKLKDKNQQAYTIFLLKIACEFNLLNEVHSLLESVFFNDINRPLSKEEGGQTLLGIAAFHGNFETVCYLVEVAEASVNAQDQWGNTALHQVVYGDNARTYGSSHDRIAEYLFNLDKIMTCIKNNKGKTAQEETKSFGYLTRVEEAFGGQIFNSSSYFYRLKKIKPVFFNAPRRRYQVICPQTFTKFCLDHAIVEYIKNGNQEAFGYTFNKLITDLAHLPSQKTSKAEYYLRKESWKSWEEIEAFINSQVPPHSDLLFGAIVSNFPKISSLSLVMGSMVGLFIHYGTQDLSFSMGIGIMFAAYLFLAIALHLENKESKYHENESKKILEMKYRKNNLINQVKSSSLSRCGFYPPSSEKSPVEPNTNSSLSLR